MSFKREIISLIIAVLKVFNKRKPLSMERASFIFPAYTGLGNFIMMTPIIRTLRERFPSCHIYILAGNDFGTEAVLKDTGLVNDIWILHESENLFQKLFFFLRLRTKKIDVAFIPFNASPSFYGLGALVAGIPLRIGHTSEIMGVESGWTAHVPTVLVPVQVNRHETDIHFDLLEVLLPSLKRKYDTTVHRDIDDGVLDRFKLRGKDYIVLQVSAANGMRSAKIWPQERFLDLAERIHGRKMEIVLAGDRMEKEVVDRFESLCPVPVTNLAGRTTIGEIASLIRCSKGLVCHDSGLMHIGNALKTPLIALYGPTDYNYTHPMAETSAVIRKDLACAPCMANFAKTEQEAFNDCPFDFRCMELISVEEVFQEIRTRMLHS
jgi:heptosyltransferase-2